MHLNMYNKTSKSKLQIFIELKKMLTVASFGQLEPSSGMKEKKTLKTNCKIKGNTLL